MDATKAIPIPPNDPAHGAAGGGMPRGVPSLTPLRELHLLEAHRRGDPDAIGELLRSYQRRIYSICHRMVRHEHDARDLTQETMLKILEGLDSYSGRSKLSTWVIRVTMNCCLSHLRKQKIRRHGSLDGLSGEDPAGPTDRLPAARELSAPRRVEQAEMRSILLRALSRLDEDMRAVLVLRDLQELEYQQIGGVLGIPLGTVKSRLFRARLALRATAEQELDRTATDHEP